jgi:PAS domain S-box-containing protein
VSAREIERNNRELTKANDLLKEEVATRTRVDRAVRESEETHRALFKESPNAKIAFDVNTLRIVAANDAALHLYGYSSEEFLAMSLRDICESDYAVPNDPMVTPPHERTGTVEHRTRTGRKFTAQLSSALVNLRGQRVRITCVTDVTERQQLEAQLHHSQKMEAVGRLAGGIAHDFNNMLSIMLGYAILVLDEMPTTDPAYPALVEIKRAAERSADLTKQLLAFSRQQSRSVEVLDVNDVVRGTEKLVRRLVGENIEIVTHLEPKGCRALVDAGQLEQIIMNLVVNARDALPKGGRLTIETTFAELDELYVAKHEGVAPGRYVLLAVSDDGVGMDQATQARIFEPFFTTKEQGRGTGLGLAMVFGIVQQAGGLVWVYSEPGRGATFKVYLPATDQAVPEATAEMHARGGSGTETILLVEDEDQVRALVERVLRGRGYRVLTAASPSVALEVAGKYPAHIDLLLTDVMMPQMNGRELSDKLFTTRPSIRVLYMSGYTDNVVLDHGVPGDLAFLQKPITPNVLSRKLRELLDSSEKAN